MSSNKNNREDIQTITLEHYLNLPISNNLVSITEASTGKHLTIGIARPPNAHLAYRCLTYD